jgi:LacI family transcriptional regulator
MEGGYSAAELLLKKRNPPSAIYVRSDVMAMAAMRAALDLGLRVPQDLSIVGFGDIPMARYLNPRLTTISQPQPEMGAKAAALLFERLEHRDLPTRQMLIEPSLVIRQSTAHWAKERI